MTIAPILTFATFTLPAGEVYQLVTTESPPPIGPGPVIFNLLNVGPDYIYIRESIDPAIGDPNSEMLPPSCADNGIFVPDGAQGLRVLAGPSGATIVVRVAVPQYA